MGQLAPAPISILAEVLAAAMNPSCAGGDQAAVYLERCAVRCLMELVGFPIPSEGKVFLTGTKLRGTSWLRSCILHYATGESDLDELVDAVKRQAVALSPGTRGLIRASV